MEPDWDCPRCAVQPGISEPQTSLIVLHPLSGAETEGLIGNRLGGARLPSDALARLTDVVEEDPFPAEETLRMLVDDGRLVREAAPTTGQRC